MIIAVDFDGTIVEHDYPNIGRPVPGAIRTLRELALHEHNLILWTMRSDTTLQEAVSYLSDAGIKLWGVNSNPTQGTWTNSPKQYAQIYIDDAALGCPLIRKSSKRAYVDWDAVRKHLVEMGALPMR